MGFAREIYNFFKNFFALLTLLGNSDTINTTHSPPTMEYVLYDENFDQVGTFTSIQQMRNFLCERKYDIGDKTYMEDTFDYIKSIKWHFDIKQD